MSSGNILAAGVKYSRLEKLNKDLHVPEDSVTQKPTFLSIQSNVLAENK
jgi:hypothetical protein